VSRAATPAVFCIDNSTGIYEKLAHVDAALESGIMKRSAVADKKTKW
jgi:hypothetical protein